MVSRRIGIGQENLLCQVRGRVYEWSKRLLPGGQFGVRRPAGPHQHVTVFVHGKALRLDHLRLQILEGLIIEVELSFERAISHAVSTLEHGNRLIHNLLEGHGRPLHCFGACVKAGPTSVKVGVIRKEHREDTRNMKEWQENTPRCKALA
jgi:hypothetical protein